MDQILKVLNSALESKEFQIEYLNKEIKQLKEELKALQTENKSLKNDLAFYMPPTEKTEAEKEDF